MRPWHVPVCKMGYSRNIPYPDFFEKMYVAVLIWDIPYPRFSEELHVLVLKWDIPFPRILEELYVPLFLGISHIPIFFKKGMYQFFMGYPISQIFMKRYTQPCFEMSEVHIWFFFFKLCILVCSAVLSCPFQLPKLIHS